MVDRLEAYPTLSGNLASLRNVRKTAAGKRKRTHAEST